MQAPFSWKPHSLALVGPLLLWGVFLYLRGATLDVFGENLNPMLLGVIPGMSLGYLLCLLKLRPKTEPAASRSASPGSNATTKNHPTTPTGDETT